MRISTLTLLKMSTVIILGTLPYHTLISKDVANPSNLPMKIKPALKPKPGTAFINPGPTAQDLAKDFSKEQLLANVATQVGICQKMTAFVDGKTQQFWNYKPKAFELKKKKILKALNQEMPFAQYLAYINDLKLNSAKKKSELEALINTWPANRDLHTLNMKVSEDLRAYSSFCSGPVKTINDHIQKREALVKK